MLTCTTVDGDEGMHCCHLDDAANPEVGSGPSEFQWTCTNCMVCDAVLVRFRF